MKVDIKKTVFVFDLDDTLYKEADYHTSGIRAVANVINKVYDFDAESYFKDKVNSGEADLWGAVCEQLKLPETVKQSIIWEYRLHKPEITLETDIRVLLDWLEHEAAGLAILTDGRSMTQRLKAGALGLSHIPIYISEEYGAAKPDVTRFELIQNKYLDYDCIYIGDNPAKDFLAPNLLGWKTLGLTGDNRNIHSQDTSILDKNYLPDCWISKLEELKKIIC